MISENQSTKKSILLIGSTVEGKKALAQFLLNQDTIHDPNTPWKSKIQSHNGLVHSSNSKKFHLNIIDIPGFTIKKSSDIQHVIDIAKQLKDLPETVIAACVVVIELNSRCDQLLYKETVQYYANLLPSLFEQNLTIVMIHVGEPQALQKKQRLDIKVYIVNEVMNSASLSYSPEFFMISYHEKVTKESSEIRDAILKHVASCKPLSIADKVIVSKPRYLIEMDKDKVKELQDAIADLDIEVSKCKEKEYSKSNILQQLEADLALTNEKIAYLQKQIEEHNNSDLVVVDTWSMDSEWKFLRRCTGSFELHSEWNIDSVEQWEEGDARWIFSERTDFRLAGMVVGQRNKGLHASLTIKTMKRHKYVQDILKWQNQMEEQLQLQKVQHDNLESCKKDIQNCHDKLEILHQFVQRKQGLIMYLSSANMTIDDTIEALNNINNC